MASSNLDVEKDRISRNEPIPPDVVVPEEFEDEAIYARAAAGRAGVPAHGAKPTGDDHGTPGDQERVMTAEEKHDKALEDTFPTSDPIPPSHIDGPGD